MRFNLLFQADEAFYRNHSQVISLHTLGYRIRELFKPWSPVCNLSYRYLCYASQYMWFFDAERAYLIDDQSAEPNKFDNY